ncbi:hypothetical protein ACYFX5_15990 [Bremerella sp. T1]|uniref:hypothetical protein n=1 Tax=Bremerella sp. TYQ1 TaxID=3119568 RepID=UPI001CC96348|nr:hypothetical protein [Bremerella volcania]UBM34558.1 hypothetical protein LA756_17940 [Bremerella volcania]
MTEYKCPDCEVLMEQGFIPDRVNTGYDMTYWMNGQFTSMTAMGFARGTGGVSMLVATFRCPECGLLREYALPENR